MNHFAEQLAALRPALVRLARHRVRNSAWAEDAVSETLVAALENPQAFAGQAQLKTWLVGILKHKLVDQMRRHGREHNIGVDDDDDAFDAWADTTPLWGIEAAGSWGDPQAHLERRQFIGQLEDSLRTLPGKQGKAFMLRECLDVDTEEVCNELGVTANNLSVMLHRARRSLRDSLRPLWTPLSQRAQAPA